jgi:hypothetical protein
MSPTEPTDPTEHLPPMDALDSDTPRPGSRRGLVTALVAVLALVVAGVAGAALAGAGDGGGGGEAALAGASGTAAATPAPGDKAGDRAERWKGGPGMIRGRGHLRGAGGALHGSFVVPDGSGGYRTLLMQHGTATDVSDTSITVRSEDGFEQTYAITGDTAVGADRQGVGGIAKGADVAVLGEKKGSGVTALYLADLAAWGRGMGPGGMGGMGGPQFGPDGARPAPTPSGAAEGSAYGA